MDIHFRSNVLGGSGNWLAETNGLLSDNLSEAEFSAGRSNGKGIDSETSGHCTYFVSSVGGPIKSEGLRVHAAGYVFNQEIKKPQQRHTWPWKIGHSS